MTSQSLTQYNVDLDDNEKSYTNEEVVAASKKCASAFYRMGLKKGDVVALCLGNCFEFVFISIGAFLCGAVVATNNPMYTEKELTHQLTKVQPKFVFAHSTNYETVANVCARMSTVKAIITIENEGPSKYTFSKFFSYGKVSDYPLPVQVGPEDDAIIFFSSGTTGLPKGVLLSHGNFTASIVVTNSCPVVAMNSRSFAVIPCFHIFGALTLLASAAVGPTTYIRKRLDPMQMLMDIEKHKINLVPVAPPMIVGLSKLPPNLGIDLSSLCVLFSGGASMPMAAAQAVEKKLNLHINQGYGMTEATPMLTHFHTQGPLDAAGSVPPNHMLKVIDPDTGKELVANQDGEICFKGPMVMRGYLGNPEATAKCIDSEGWLHTGDIGHYDDRDFIYIVARIKELIKYKAFQVSPAELDDVLLCHPKVADAAVIGIPDPDAGELPKAFVVKKDPSVTEQEIHDFMKDKVSKFKYLRGGITFIEEIPKSPTGKILRRVLMKMEKEAKSSKV